MSLHTEVQPIPLDAVGFAVSGPLSSETISSFKKANYLFAARSISPSSSGLNLKEIEAILSSDLGLVILQPISESSSPDGALGKQDAAFAIKEAQGCGLPSGTQIWLDAGNRAPSDLLDYAHSWTQAISDGKMSPGLIIGTNGGLGVEEIDSLPFQGFGRSSESAGIYPARGFCLFRATGTDAALAKAPYQRYAVQPDNLGTVPTWVSGHHEAIVPKPSPAKPFWRRLLNFFLALCLFVAGVIAGPSLKQSSVYQSIVKQLQSTKDEAPTGDVKKPPVVTVPPPLAPATVKATAPTPQKPVPPQPAAVVKPAVTTQAKPAPYGVVQVASLDTEEAAEALVKKIADQGLGTSTIKHFKQKRGLPYQVQQGPFQSLSDCQAAAQGLENKLGLSPLIKRTTKRRGL